LEIGGGVVAQLGTVNAEGFAPAVSRETRVAPQFGVVNADGSIATVRIERTARPASGDLHLEGFAPTVTTEGETLVSPEVGYIHAVGLTPTTTTIGDVTTPELPQGRGGGGYPDYDDDLEVILMICKKFLEEVA
jgi:hypothetical protein